MTWLNLALGRLVTLLLTPFEGMTPMVGLAVVSLLTAVALLLVVRATSDQVALAAVKRRMHAGIFEIRLFNDDLRAMLRAQGQVLAHNLTYLRLSVVPMLWVMAPVVLLLAQLQFYYGYRGLDVGQAALVKVRFDDSTAAPAPALTLDVPEGLRVETPMVWIPSEREAAWRVAAEQPGEYVVSVTHDGRAVSKTVRVSADVGWRTPERLAPTFLNQLLYPAEPPIDADIPIAGIWVTYPEREINLLGWRTHWMVVFFVLSMVFAFALRKRLGVVI